MGIKIIIPFLGRLSDFNKYSLNSLINAIDGMIEVELILIFDRDPGLTCRWHHVNDIFKYENILNIDLEELKKAPYKLCDLRTVYDLIFNISDFEYIGWCDLDVIYGLGIAEALESLNYGVGGLGHFTCLKSSIYKKFQNKLLKDKRPLFNIERNYALDEHRFLHKFLQTEGIELKKLEIIDVDPRLKKCTDFDGRKINDAYIDQNGKLFVSNFNGVIVEVKYIHFQKRRIDISKLIKNNKYTSIVMNGNIIIDEKNQIAVVRFLKFYISRINYHLKNGSLIVKQSL